MTTHKRQYTRWKHITRIATPISFAINSRPAQLYNSHLPSLSTREPDIFSLVLSYPLLFRLFVYLPLFHLFGANICKESVIRPRFPPCICIQMHALSTDTHTHKHIYTHRVYAQDSLICCRYPSRFIFFFLVQRNPLSLSSYVTNAFPQRIEKVYRFRCFVKASFHARRLNVEKLPFALMRFRTFFFFISVTPHVCNLV